MNVYVEYVIIDNMFFDCLVLWSASATLRLKTPWWRIALGGAVGTVCAFLAAVINGVAAYIVKAACLLAMCCVTVGFGRKLLRHILLTLAYTFILGGIVVGLFFLLQVNFTTAGGFAYTSQIPLGVYGGAVALFALLAYTLYNYVSSARRNAASCKKVTLHTENDVTVVGFCDSGNTLMHNGAPVCFVMRKIKGLEEYAAKCVLCGKAERIKVLTVAGEETVLAVPAEICTKESREVYLAFPKAKCDVGYDLLLNALFAEVDDEKNNVASHKRA